MENDITDDEWIGISKNRILPEKFIREFQDLVDWYEVSQNQILSEDFIIEFENRIAWKIISVVRKFSDEFLREYNDKIRWEYYFNHQNVSFEVMKKFVSKSGFLSTKYIETEHLNDFQIKEIERILELKNMFIK